MYGGSWAPAAQWIRTLPIGDYGITAPTLWACLGDAPARGRLYGLEGLGPGR